MKRKNIIFIVLLIVALITSILSLVIFVLSKIHTQQKEDAEIIYKVIYEDDSEPGATTTYYLYDNGNIMFSHKKYCSIPDCEPEIIESEPLNLKEENLQIAYNYLKSLIPNGNEVTVFQSKLSTTDYEMLFYISITLILDISQ